MPFDRKAYYQMWTALNKERKRAYMRDYYQRNKDELDKRTNDRYHMRMLPKEEKEKNKRLYSEFRRLRMISV